MRKRKKQNEKEMKLRGSNHVDVRRKTGYWVPTGRMQTFGRTLEQSEGDTAGNTLHSSTEDARFEQVLGNLLSSPRFFVQTIHANVKCAY
jgi:hypothetical protein